MAELPAAPDRSQTWVVAPEPLGGQVLTSLGSADVWAEQALPDVVLQEAKVGDRVILAGLPLAETVLLSEQLLEKRVGVAIETTGTTGLRRSLGERWKGVDCVRLAPARADWLDRRITRLRDVVTAAGALVVLSPAFLISAILVKRSSPGPVFFSTTVVGRNGSTFRWRKIRTMRVGTGADDLRRREQYRELVASGAGTGAAGSTKIVDESRITPVGRFLRRHSLDELPQLWNVLVGEMTLVGPRPCLPYEYELQLPWQRLRYRVTPGLTGPWQAYGRSRVSVDEMALIDYCYGHRRGFWLDLRIVAKTVKVVVDGEGGQ